MAKAVAGEAGVPFSAFLALSLWKCLWESAPQGCETCLSRQSNTIVFIDELDAIGKSRGLAASMGATMSVSKP